MGDDAATMHYELGWENMPGQAVAPMLDTAVPSGRLSAGVLAMNLIGVGAPMLGIAAAIVLSWGWGCSWIDIGLLIGFYIATAFGITVGFHRLFTHRSFR